MKGKLNKTEQGWVIKYFGESLPLYQETFDINNIKQPIIPLVEGNEYEIELIEVCHTNAQVGHKFVNYAKLISAIPYVSDDFQIGPDGAYEHKESKKVSWDELFNDVESKLDIYIPIRAINYIKNNYKKPKRKK
jgi:hypothetical protein